MTKSWDIKRIYFYLVCLVTLIMLIFGTVQFVQAVVELAYPEPTYTDSLLYREKFDPDNSLSAEEREALFEKEQQIQIQREENYKIRRIINSLALIVVALPIYLYHWRKVQKLEV